LSLCVLHTYTFLCGVTYSPSRYYYAWNLGCGIYLRSSQGQRWLQSPA
jgi:hypothetical protein